MCTVYVIFCGLRLCYTQSHSDNSHMHATVQTMPCSTCTRTCTLTQARPTMSCIHLVHVYVYLVPILLLLWWTSLPASSFLVPDDQRYIRDYQFTYMHIVLYCTAHVYVYPHFPIVTAPLAPPVLTKLPLAPTDWWQPKCNTLDRISIPTSALTVQSTMQTFFLYSP